jgi:arabinogalactan oligomer/maltooligosaccharide transport system substrate-binding protein
MMGALHAAMAKHSGTRATPQRRRVAVVSLSCALGLTGCAGGIELPSLLYLAIGTNNDQIIDAELVADVGARLKLLEWGFRQIYPSTRFQFAAYPEDEIKPAMARRNGAGLGPDLLLINGDTAKQLVNAGLADPFPLTPTLANLFNPGDLERLRLPDGDLAGLPVIIHSQVACFNRKRLPKPPSTLTELLETSAKGHNIGLSVELSTLFWTAGSMGATDAWLRVVQGKRLSRENVNSIENWTAWLQDASDQQRITFYSNQASALTEFSNGRLDWISCSSTNLPRLRKSLGASLGVSNLPSGPGGSASPINRLRVLALGRSSSRQGRERALAFSRFSVNPLVQRSITLGSQILLPANRFVKVPVQSSVTLQAMSDSQEASLRTAELANLLHVDDPRLDRAQNLITQLVFGEISPQGAATALIALMEAKP